MGVMTRKAEKLMISREDVSKMSLEEIKEYNNFSHCGWFSDSPDWFEVLNNCFYDIIEINNNKIYSSDGREWKHFLPVERLQELLERKLNG